MTSKDFKKKYGKFIFLFFHKWAKETKMVCHAKGRTTSQVMYLINVMEYFTPWLW
jgi:hypothetical protein